MPGILLSGPAGAGKSFRAQVLLASLGIFAVKVDFQDIYAALLGLRRGPDGRYPERKASDAYALPFVERMRLVMIATAIQQQLTPIVTNSDGNRQRRRFLLNQMGGDAREEVVDPGERVVRNRLAGPDGKLSEQCESAINRWYGRL